MPSGRCFSFTTTAFQIRSAGFVGYRLKNFKQMGLKGEMVTKVEIKSDADTFFKTCQYKPHHFSNMSPNNVRNVDLHEGDLGTAGSVTVWHYNQDGKEKTNKVLLEVINEEKKLLTLAAVDGDFLQRFKTFRITLQVDKEGETNLVMWTLEYEKLSEDVEDPTTYMDVLIAVTKDIEAYHLEQYNSLREV